MNSLTQSNTIKLRETPKAGNYDSFDEISCVMTTNSHSILKKPIAEEKEVVCEIYIINCKITGKNYVGQTVSHVLNHTKYRRYGTHKRFKSHISEALKNTKKCQCFYLNNAIRKYGSDSFTHKVIEICSRDDADERELYNITKYNSLAPNGYNLKFGGKQFRHTVESRLKVGNGMECYSDIKRLEKYSNYIIPCDVCLETLIHPLKRDGKQIGWYVMYNSIHGKIKTDFAGVTRNVDECYNRAKRFIIKLQENERSKNISGSA